jgi:apolipoprotein N-acyltransferase
VSESAVELPPAQGTPDSGPPAASLAGSVTAVRPLPGAAAAGLAVAGGVLLDLSFPNPGWWPLAPVGVAALLLAVRGRSAVVAAGLGLIFGLAFFLPVLHWSGVYVGVLPWAALATLEALYITVMAGLLPRAWRAPGGVAGTTLAVAGLWVAAEALRDRTPFGGFPWARLAFSQADAPSLGLAVLGGAPLLTGVVAASGALLACAAVAIAAAARAPRPGEWRARFRRAAPAVAMLAVAVALILAGLAVPATRGGRAGVQVAAVQGNVPRPGLEFNAERRAVLDNHVAATRALAQRVRRGQAPQPDLVLWPENSSDIDPLRNPDATAVITAAVNDVRAPTLVGGVLEQPPGRLSNVTIVWGPAGSAAPGPGQVYVKRHPAPFGEYIPYRSFFRRFSPEVDLVARNFVAGHRVGVLDAGQARIGDLICFEIAYDNLVRDTVRAGAQLIVVQTNNATFGYTDESVQQLAMSRVRAVESGRAVVHVSTVGVSALIRPDGSVIRQTELFRTGVLQARLPLIRQRTLATRAGEWPELVLAVTGLVLVAAAGRTGRRRRPAEAADAAGER